MIPGILSKPTNLTNNSTNFNHHPSRSHQNKAIQLPQLPIHEDGHAIDITGIIDALLVPDQPNALN